jgi:hypothetical protein
LLSSSAHNLHVHLCVCVDMLGEQAIPEPNTENNFADWSA